VPAAGKVGHVPLSSILPSPENDQLYRPIDIKDIEIVALAKSIRINGVLESLILTADNYIVSGHRRYAAAKLAGLEAVPVRRLQIRRDDDLNAFVHLLCIAQGSWES
jgi:ParB-like chromosome segregation protein Spo0J